MHNYFYDVIDGEISAAEGVNYPLSKANGISDFINLKEKASQLMKIGLLYVKL